MEQKATKIIKVRPQTISMLKTEQKKFQTPYWFIIETLLIRGAKK